MFTLRIDNETKEMLAYLRRHNIRFQPKLKDAFKVILREYCKEFKRKESRIKDAPEWLYE